MSQVLLTGATGLVGGHLLRLLQNEPRISIIAAPTRRPLAPAEGVFNPYDPQLTDALAQVGEKVVALANAEDLPAHGEAIRARLER